MTPIPVTERLPDIDQPCFDGTDRKRSSVVLAYDAAHLGGWCLATYSTRGWALDTEGISGPEWDVWEPENVTHWMPLPPKPEGI